VLEADAEDLRILEDMEKTVKGSRKR